MRVLEEMKMGHRSVLLSMFFMLLNFLSLNPLDCKHNFWIPRLKK